jgi:hypothetical protein
MSKEQLKQQIESYSNKIFNVLEKEYNNYLTALEKMEALSRDKITISKELQDFTQLPQTTTKEDLIEKFMDKCKEKKLVTGKKDNLQWKKNKELMQLLGLTPESTDKVCRKTLPRYLIKTKKK